VAKRLDGLCRWASSLTTLWMDQDATWYGGRPWPKPHCIGWGSSQPASKGAQQPLFSPLLLRPNGWMDQDTTWYGGRPWTRPRCVRLGPIFPHKKGAQQPPQFSAHVYCDQTDGWIKMPFGTEVGVGPGDIGTQLPHPWNGAQQLSHFSSHVCYGPTVAHLSYC